MSNLFGLFLVFVFSFNATASICDLSFLATVDKNIVPDFRLANKINFYENSISVVKRLKMRRTYVELNEVRAVNKRWFKNFKEIESHIFKGSIELGEQRLRKTYRNISTSLSKVDEYKRSLKALKVNPNKADLSLLDDLKISSGTRDELRELLSKNSYDKAITKIHKKLRGEYRRLGGNFNKFEYNQSRLEKLLSAPECKANCQEGIAKLQKKLGLNKKLSEVRDIFINSPEAIVIARKKEFLSESLSFFTNILSKINFTKSILYALDAKGIYHSSKLVKLFKTSYDKKARNLHRSIIDKVSMAKLTPKQRADLIKRELITYPDESFVVNFARAEDYYAKKAWNEVKDYASKSKDLEFFNLIKNAEAIAKRLGKVGGFSVIKVLKRVALIVGAGAVVVYLVGSNSEIITIEEEGEDDPVQNGSVIIEEDDDSEVETQVIQLKYGNPEEQEFYDFVKDSVEELDGIKQ